MNELDILWAWNFQDAACHNSACETKKAIIFSSTVVGCVALLSNVPRKIELRVLALGGGREANLSLSKRQVAPSIKHFR